MRKLIKITIWSIVTIFVIVAIAGFVIVKFVNLNNYKPQIEQLVDSKLGRSLTITGDINWSLYPNIGIKLGTASLSNPPGYKQKTFASIKSADISLAVWPLMQGEINVNNIDLHELALNLIQKGKTNNWNFGQKPTNSPGETANTNNSNANTITKTTNKFNLAINAINVTNANLTYSNLIDGNSYKINDFNFKAKNISGDKPFPIELTLNLSSKKPKLETKIDLTTELSLNSKQQIFKLNNLKLQANIKTFGDRSKDNPIQTLLKGNATLDTSNSKLSLTTTLTINKQLNAEGKLNVSSLLDNNNFSGDINIKPFDLNTMLASLNYKAPTLPNPNTLSKVAMQLKFSGDKNRISITGLKANTNYSNLSGKITLNNFSAPNILAKFHLNKIDVANYLDLNGALLPMNGLTLTANMDMQGLTADLFPSSLNGNLNFTIGHATLKGIDIGAVLNSVANTAQSMFDPRQRGSGWANLQNQLAQIQTRINPNNGKQTEIGNFHLNSIIQNGVLTIENSRLQGSNFSIDLNGNLNLNNSYLDLMLLAYNNETSNDTSLIKIPYFVKGSIPNLHYGVDWPMFQKQINIFLTKAIQHNLGNVIQQQAGKLLNNLFGN